MSSLVPIEQHPFEPFLPEGARILFLGSFPPQAHRWCMPFYYPNWINDFWRIMGLIHFGDKAHFCVPGEKRFDEAAIRAFCTREGLAFYDTACEVRRLKDNASDAFLEVVTPTDIPALLARIPECHTLVTTGEKASQIVAATFACPIPPVGGYTNLVMPSLGSSFAGLTGESPRALRFWRMPSTSRAYPPPPGKESRSLPPTLQITPICSTLETLYSHSGPLYSHSGRFLSLSKDDPESLITGKHHAILYSPAREIHKETTARSPSRGMADEYFFHGVS